MYAPNVTPTPAYWNLRLTKCYVNTPGDIIDFDYNITSDKLFAVDSTNSIFYSDMAVTPVYLWSVSSNSDKVQISPISYFGSNTTLKASLGREISVSNLATVKFDTGTDHMFTLEGIQGSRSINSRNPITADVILNYPCPDSDGNINTFEFSGSYLIVPRGEELFVDYFDIATGVSAGSIAVGSTAPLIYSCQMTSSGSLTAYTDAASIVVLQNSAGTITEVFVDQTEVSSNITQIYAICANELDTRNSLPTLFVYGETANPSEWALQQYEFGAGFSSISLIRTIQIWNTTDPLILHLDCIFNMGAVVLTAYNGSATVYYQGSSTPYDFSNVSTFSLGRSITNCSIPQNIAVNGVIDWKPFSSSGPSIVSVALSKYNPTSAYVISSMDSLIYPVKIDYNTQTFTFDPSFTPISNEIYSFVSTYTTYGAAVSSTVASFQIGTQTQLGSINYPSTTITAISRNEIDEQFCLIDSGVFKTYTPTLTLVTSGTTAGLGDSTCLDVRNGEDLSAGLYSIYDMNQVVAQINAAFAECFLRLQSQGTTLTKAPSLTLDFQSGLLTLVYDASYLVADRYIAFNDALMAIAYFSNNAGRIILPGPATSLTQSSRTIFNFNDLQSVQFRSNNIFVTGQFYSTNLSSSRIICEIDPDTTTFVNNIGVRLYYNPTILRSFFLNSSLPLQTISISLFYTTKEGKEYQMTLNPNDFFSTKLNFIRKY
jgi:hypothetical protein